MKVSRRKQRKEVFSSFVSTSYLGYWKVVYRDYYLMWLHSDLVPVKAPKLNSLKSRFHGSVDDSICLKVLLRML